MRDLLRHSEIMNSKSGSNLQTFKSEENTLNNQNKNYSYRNYLNREFNNNFKEENPRFIRDSMQVHDIEGASKKNNLKSERGNPLTKSLLAKNQKNLNICRNYLDYKDVIGKKDLTKQYIKYELIEFEEKQIDKKILSNLNPREMLTCIK